MDLDIAAFRAAYPAFADAILYPDAMLNAQWDIGLCYVSDRGCGCVRPDGTDCRQSMLWLMLAHLLQMNTAVAAGGASGGGMVSQARIDKVQVTLVAPPVSNAWDWWLNQTPYGAQLLALLTLCGTGGMYAGGLPETTAFRKWGGVFGRGLYGR